MKFSRRGKTRRKNKKKGALKGGTRKFLFFNRDSLPRAITKNVKRHSLGSSKRESPREKKDEQVCAICTQSLLSNDETIVKTTCGHYFHNECLATWFKGRHYDCPYCRQQFTRKEIDFFTGEDIVTVADDNVRMSVRRVDDESSRKRKLTEEEKEIKYATGQLREMTYDPKYKNYFDNIVSPSFYDQASDKIDLWCKDGRDMRFGI